MDPNGIRSSSPTPSTTSTDSGIQVTPSKTGSAFTRTARAVTPELNQQNLEPPKTPTTKIKDRVPSDLTSVQKLKLGLLRLGAALLGGTKANHWLADKALGLLKSAYSLDQRTVAVKVQAMVDSQLIQLDPQQSESYASICQNFADQDEMSELLGDEEESRLGDVTPKLEFASFDEEEDEGIRDMDTASTSPEVIVDEEMQQHVNESLSFMGRMNTMHDTDRSSEALKMLEKEFFDGASHKALKNPIVKMAKSEDVQPEAIAGIFNEVVYEVVIDDTAPLPVKDLEKLRIMTQSMRDLFPDASNFDKTTYAIDEQLLDP